VTHTPEDAKCETVLDLLNVRFVVTGHEVRKEGYTEVYQSDGEGDNAKVYVFERATALPRAYLTGGAMTAGSAREALDALCTLDPRQNCVVEGKDGISGGVAFKEIQLERQSEERMRLEFAADAPGVVIVSQTWHPDWDATVNGVPTEVLKVNHAQVGVPVGAGEQEVVLWYRPWDLYVGLLVSGATVIVLGILCFFEWRRKALAVN